MKGEDDGNTDEAGTLAASRSNGACRTAPPCGGSTRRPVRRTGAHLWFVDHLRVVLICGVVVAHVAALYGGGGFYQYHDLVPPDVFTSSVLGIPALIAEMFGMGVFFLLAGYFTPGSYDRKGGAAFVRDRLVRLGIPLVVYDLLLDPLTIYLARGRPGSYLLQLRTIGPEVAWFIVALLLFTLLYAAGVPSAGSAPPPSPGRPHCPARAPSWDSSSRWALGALWCACGGRCSLAGGLPGGCSC